MCPNRQTSQISDEGINEVKHEPIHQDSRVKSVFQFNENKHKSYQSSNSNSTRASDDEGENTSDNENNQKKIEAPFLYKTKLCQKYEEHGVCPYGTKCQFAHGKGELRKHQAKRKKKVKINKKNIPCMYYMAGKECPHGEFCRFIHEKPTDESSLSSPVPRDLENDDGDEINNQENGYVGIEYLKDDYLFFKFCYDWRNGRI